MAPNLEWGQGDDPLALPPGVAVPLDTVTLDSTKLRVHFIDIGPGLAMRS